MIKKKTTPKATAKHVAKPKKPIVGLADVMLQLKKLDEQVVYARNQNTSILKTVDNIYHKDIINEIRNLIEEDAGMIGDSIIELRNSIEAMNQKTMEYNNGFLYQIQRIKESQAMTILSFEELKSINESQIDKTLNEMKSKYNWQFIFVWCIILILCTTAISLVYMIISD